MSAVIKSDDPQPDRLLLSSELQANVAKALERQFAAFVPQSAAAA